nr:carboxylesterase [Pharsalia antennata]
MTPKVFICVTVLVLINLKIASAAESDDPIVELPEGKIRGQVLKSEHNKPYYAFQQIPYASPPVGTLRFKEPQAPKSWEEVLNTTTNTVVCFQGNTKNTAPNVEESEDCLYINVYTPLKPGSKATALPVMVWIHGGDFYHGDGTFQSYGPQYIIDYGVVVVTFNYRLGPFGFLTAADEVIPANIGLKDQSFALQWVNKNIELFGGNSSLVTIFGQNTGGVSVGYHLVSTEPKELFRAAIMQSGTVLSAFGYQANARHFAFEMGRSLDPSFTSTNSKDLLELLQNASATDINNAIVDIPSGMEIGLGNNELVWLPIIENINFTGALITDPMHEDLQNGVFKRVPIMLGYNSEEQIELIEDDKSLTALGTQLDGNFSLFIRNKFNMSDASKYIAGRALRQIYTKDVFQKNLVALVKFMGDEGYTTPIIRHAELQSKFTDVYLYQFSHKGMLGGLNLTLTEADWVGDKEDLNYIWSNAKSDTVLSLSDRVTQHRILKLWTNFVKYLNPTPDGDKALLSGDITWPKVTPTNITYLNINRTLEIKTDPKEYQAIKIIIDRYATSPLVTY